MARILIVDDERSMREFLEIMLRHESHAVAHAEDAVAAIAYLNDKTCDVVVSDLRLPAGSGMDVLAHAKRVQPHCQVIMMTAYASTETAIEAMKLGAYDYLIKPFKVDEVSVVIGRALERQALERENVELRNRLEGRSAAGRLLGKSDAMRDVYELIRKVAPTRTTVLLTGESGTGKELVARAIHLRGPRADGPFVPVHCGAIPENLIESELFGHMKGAFTGANVSKPGLFEAANGGTLFLDEIGELPGALQVKLLRVLQERRLRRVGGIEDIVTDARVVAATNRDLTREVAEGRFREDLYYRLNVIQIRLPTLQQRQADVPMLAEAFLHRFSEEQGRAISGFSDEAMELLVHHPWRGNVRELENAIERAVTLSESPLIGVGDLPASISEAAARAEMPPDGIPHLHELPDDGVDLESLLDAYERQILVAALKKCNGVQKHTASFLNLSFRSLRYRLSKLGLRGGEHSTPGSGGDGAPS